MKSRKQLEAQQRLKREMEEKQRIKNEEIRLETERRKREQQEKEEYEARIKHERLVREIELCRQHLERSAGLFKLCTESLKRSSVDQWHLKLFQWCMRCDGLPDPSNLPQLNAYRYRWKETSRNTEPSMDRLLSRAPELNQVLHDLNELLENTHDIPSKKIKQLIEMRFDLSKLLSQEIDAAIKSVLSDVEKHLVPDESQLNVQTCSKSFCLGLGTDTAKNTSLTLHDFNRVGVKVDLPQVVLANERPVVVSLVWLREGHYLEPPLLNGVPGLPSLSQPISNDDTLYNYVNDSMKIDHCPKTKILGQQDDNNDSIQKELKSDEVDFETSFLVAGIIQLQLLQLPVQPRRFSQWTVAPLEDGDTIKIYEFQASFSGANAAKESAEKSGKGKHDDDDEGGDAKEMNEELKKLISIKIKLPQIAFWLGVPKPVVYQKDSGKWRAKGVWDVRYNEEAGGPALMFRLEEPSLIGLVQSRRANLPLLGWTLFPSHLRSVVMNALTSKAPTEAVKGANETRVGGGGGGGGEWEAGMSDESSDEEEVGGGGRGIGGPTDPLTTASDDQEEIEYDPDALSVTLTLTGSTVSLDIEIQEHHVVLRRVRTAIAVNVQDLTGRPMTPFELIKNLRRRGLEISPSFKVSQMVEELAKNKNRCVERHLYRCLAFLIASEKFSFMHSRWNVLAGDDNFVIQYQLLDKETPGQPCLAQVSPDRTRLLPFNENSLTLEPDALKNDDSQFHADLLNAMFDAASPEVRESILNPTPAFVETIYTMLAATRPVSLG